MIRARRTRPPSVGRSMLAAVAAGAVGTIALDAMSYLDMLVRGRPASTVPAKVATRITDAVGIGLGEESRKDSRGNAIGGLLGNLTGVSVALCYGLTRRFTARPPTLPTGLAVGAVAMVTSDVPATLTGATRPSQWGWVGWLADIAPHAVYGLVTVAVHDALSGRGT